MLSNSRPTAACCRVQYKFPSKFEVVAAPAIAEVSNYIWRPPDRLTGEACRPPKISKLRLEIVHYGSILTSILFHPYEQWIGFYYREVFSQYPLLLLRLNCLLSTQYSTNCRRYSLARTSAWVPNFKSKNPWIQRRNRQPSPERHPSLLQPKTGLVRTTRQTPSYGHFGRRSTIPQSQLS